MPQTSTERSFITTDIPARLERLRWGHFHSLVVIALGITWALDGLEVTLAGAVAGASWAGGQFLSRWCGARRPLLWLAHRPARAQAPVLHHPRSLPDRHGGNGAVVGLLQFLALSLPDRGRHRRRIHGDCLGHPGVHPGPLSRMDRPRHQWQFLDRSRHRRGKLRGPPRPYGPGTRLRLARRLLHRRLSRALYSAPARMDP